VDPGHEPITAEERLYRRIPVSQNWVSESRELDPQAFAPNSKRDETGISISRAKYKSLADAAKGMPAKSYFVAVLRAEDLLAAGIVVESRPLEGDPGHAELAQLNSADRKSDRCLELQRTLARLVVSIEGPFTTDAPL